MNRRFLARPKDQWIRITANDGPFHRQYRHQQNLYRGPSQQGRHHDESGAASTSSRPSEFGHPNLDIRRRIHSSLADRTYRTQCRGNNQSVTEMLRGNHLDSGREGFNYSIQHDPLRSTVQQSTGKDSNPNGGTTKSVLWFRANEIQRPKVVTLLDRFDNAGMNVHILNIIEGNETPVDRLDCALIMLECVDTVEQEMLIRLDNVRAQSKAPLIVLTDNTTLDWSLLALREGADAIFTLNTPDEIILARSNALVRRWAVD